MVMLVAYEVQTYESGSWQIASMHEDRELALLEARRMEEGVRRRETRVVEEMHDEESGKTRSKIIYTTPKISGADSAAGGAGPRPQSRKRGGPAMGKKGPGRPVRGRGSQQAQLNPVMVGVVLFSVLSLGFLALIAMRHL